MNKPKELVGEVEKFEEVVLDIAIDNENTLLDYTTKLALLHRFYTQPFTPDMIRNYFEGWQSVEVLSDDIWENIKTLSDFIDACINSNVNLKWRE